MVTRLRDEIRQRKPFRSLQEEAALNVVRTAAILMDELERLLRPYGITGTQYNVLRILRGAPDGMCRNDLGDRMITRMPDMTRLLDRLEEAGLVSRSRETEDRRMVMTRITTLGRELVDRLDGVIDEENKRQFVGLDDAQLRTLVELLTLVRNKE